MIPDRKKRYEVVIDMGKPFAEECDTLPEVVEILRRIYEQYVKGQEWPYVDIFVYDTFSDQDMTESQYIQEAIAEIIGDEVEEYEAEELDRVREISKMIDTVAPNLGRINTLVQFQVHMVAIHPDGEVQITTPNDTAEKLASAFRRLGLDVGTDADYGKPGYTSVILRNSDWRQRP